MLIIIFLSHVLFRQRASHEVDRDENINGRRGSFPRLLASRKPQSVPANAAIARTLPMYNDGTLSMAAFRDEPVRTNPSANRQKQLESLRRMEERLQNRKAQQKTAKKTENTLATFVLDIGNILCDECSASWVSLKQNDQTGPDERILYSLVLGRGELIVFGGIRKEQTTLHGHTDIDDSQVYNDLHFINPPRYVI